MFYLEALLDSTRLFARAPRGGSRSVGHQKADPMVRNKLPRFVQDVFQMRPLRRQEDLSTSINEQRRIGRFG